MKIEFLASSEEVHDFVPMPETSKSNIPNWYKNIKAEAYKSPIFNDQNTDVVNKGIKMCMPFFDAISSGYVQKTWSDIHVKKEKDGNVSCRFPVSPQIINYRNSVSIPIDTDIYYDVEFVWKSPWIPKVPKGYSCLFTHPLNRIDLPFHTLSGIIDSDTFFHTPFGQSPFFIKKDFEGIIPAGTPMYQMIPIKRDSWKKEKAEYHDLERKKREYFMNKSFMSVYRNMFWKKKEYN